MLDPSHMQWRILCLPCNVSVLLSISQMKNPNLGKTELLDQGHSARKRDLLTAMLSLLVHSTYIYGCYFSSKPSHHWSGKTQQNVKEDLASA